MSITKTLQNIIYTVTKSFRQVINYISGAVSRIFSSTEDNYPETGLQPFEGDPADEQSP